MAAYAIFEDYADRYEAAESDRDRISALLADASAIIAAQLPGGAEPPDGLLASVACAMVSRAMGVGEMGGISDYSESAIGLSASVKFANPHGDLYLTQTEKAALGIGNGSVGVFDPWQVRR